MKNFKHDFANATLKHDIESGFYKIANTILKNSCKQPTIITGPDYLRHIENCRKYISKKLTICEIDNKIFKIISKGCEKDKDITVVNHSIENYGSSFIDCDLTCITNVKTIKNTLLKQISCQSLNPKDKVFIFSIGLRGNTKTIRSLIQPIFGVLGSFVLSVQSVKNKTILGAFQYCKELKLQKTNGRIKNIILYSYNAGGGPMLTCLIHYK